MKKTYRAIGYALFFIFLQLMAPSLVLYIPVGHQSRGAHAGFLDRVDPIRLDWSPNGEFIGVYGQYIMALNNEEVNKEHPYYLWMWKNELDRGSNADHITTRLYNSPAERTDTLWSRTGYYIAETFNQTADNPYKTTFNYRLSSDFIRIDHTVPVHNYSTLAWMPDESSILLSTFQGQLFKWTMSDDSIIEIPRTGNGFIKHMSFSSDGNFLSSLENRDGTIYLTISNVSTSFSTISEIFNHNTIFWSQWVQINNENLLFFQNNTVIQSFNPLNQQILEFMDLEKSYDEINVSPQSNYLILTNSNTVQILDLVHNQYLDLLTESDTISHVKISPDELNIAYIYNESIFVRDLHDYSLKAFLPRDNLESAWTNYIPMDLFRLLELFFVAIMIAVFEILISIRWNRKMSQKAVENSMNLYPEIGSQEKL